MKEEYELKSLRKGRDRLLAVSTLAVLVTCAVFYIPNETTRRIAWCVVLPVFAGSLIAACVFGIFHQKRSGRRTSHSVDIAVLILFGLASLAVIAVEVFLLLGN